MVYGGQFVSKHHQDLINFCQAKVFLTLLYFPNNGKCHPCPISKLLLCKMGFFSFYLNKRG